VGGETLKFKEDMRKKLTICFLRVSDINIFGGGYAFFGISIFLEIEINNQMISLSPKSCIFTESTLLSSSSYIFYRFIVFAKKKILKLKLIKSHDFFWQKYLMLKINNIPTKMKIYQLYFIFY
jgi:hypothetical protein